MMACHVALFSMDENNPRILEFQEDNGLTAIFEENYVTITRGKWKMRVMRVEYIPLTYGGKATFMIQNVLAAILAAHVRGISIEDMKAALETFLPSPSQTPGRLNLFKFNNFSFLVDYAHNPSGMRALRQFTDAYEVKWRIGIIAGIGDRRAQDTVEIGAMAAIMFDEIIIRQDENLRGKTEEELAGYIEEGIRSKKPDLKVTKINSEKEAIKHAIKNAPKDALIVLCSDLIPDALQLLEALKDREAAGKELFEI